MPPRVSAAPFDPMQTLYNELHNDPLNWGYAGMTNAQRYAKLTATDTNRTLPRDDVQPSELFAAIARADWPDPASKPKDAHIWQTILVGGNAVNMGDPSVRQLVMSVVPNPSSSRTAFLALATKVVSRAEELGIHYIDEGMVDRAWTGNW